MASGPPSPSTHYAAGSANMDQLPIGMHEPTAITSQPGHGNAHHRSTSVPDFNRSRRNSPEGSSSRRMSSIGSRSSSRHGSDHSNSISVARRYEVMAKFLHQRLAGNKWLEEYHENMYFGTANLGCFVNRGDGTYAKTTQSPAVLGAVERVGPPVAFTMSTESVSAVLENLHEGLNMVPFLDGTWLHVVPSVDDVEDTGSFSEYGSQSILCRKEHFILVCASSPPDLFALGNALEGHLVSLMWGANVGLDAFRTDAQRANSLPSSQSMPSFLQEFSFGDQPDLAFGAAFANHDRFGDYSGPPRSMSFNSLGGTQSPRARSIRGGPKSSASSIRSFHRPFNFAQEIQPSRSMPVMPPLTYAGHGRQRSIVGHHRASSVDPISPTRPPKGGAMVHMDTDRVNAITAFAAQKIAADLDRKNSMHIRAEKKQPEITTVEYPAARNGSVTHSNSHFGHIYREGFGPSPNEDVEKMMQFIEKAMYNEEHAEENAVRQRDVPRKFMLNHAILIACVVALVVTLQIWCAARLVQETRLDGTYWRWFLVVTIPIFGVFSFFFLIVIVGSCFQLFAPLSFVMQNSAFYSAKAPKLSEHVGEALPHITIQMPVYKEGLKGVIIPTINSVLKAVHFYERHGGTATIFVCDDGMQLISEELQEARRIFYAMHNIAWVSRPKQCTEPGPNYFLRKGKFKKASNMNYGLEFAGRVEDEFLRLMEERAKQNFCSEADLSVEDEDELFDLARENTRLSDEGRTWCGGDLRMGEFILLIDSDTQVPESCLLCGALEMMESPEVAILQHSSGVMNMTHSTFENGIHYFTDLVYTSITFGVAAGDCAPFVGHNAFLRWRALQTIGFMEDDKIKYWSEAHVSEDFDVSLRLQMEHFTVRMAGYHNNEFKEGVSLTIYDELARWEKYAYGCNELIFNPLIYWPTRGVFTPLFLKFLRSNVKITSKFTILAYIGTYYAIAVGFPLTIVNYFISGWSFQLDQYYQPSWKIWVGLAVVYSLLSPISFAMLRHRMGQKNYLGALGDAAKWTPFFMLFFGGLSYHIGKSLMCHFFSVQIEWTTTAKELEKTGFKIGLDRVFRDFWKMYAIIMPLIVGMIYLGLYAPFEYKITNFTIIVPMANQMACHFLLPFVLGLF